MKTFKKLSRKNVPTNPPILATAAWATILHYWGAPGWLYGVIGVFMVLGFVVYVLELILATEVEL